MPSDRERDEGSSATGFGLVRVALRDVPLLLRWRQDPVTRRYNPLRDLDEEGLRQLVERTCQPLAEGGTEARFMVTRGEAIVGHVALKNVDRANRMAELGMGIGPEHRGQGLAAVAVRLLLRHAFDAVDLERVWATAHCDNVASHRALLRAGFVREGTLRQHYVIGGRRVDHAIFGVLASEWSWDQSR